MRQLEAVLNPTCLVTFLPVDSDVFRIQITLISDLQGRRQIGLR